MNTYSHIAALMGTVHEDMIRWARALLQEAELETVEVYGQFPPQGGTSSYVVLFPYRLGPDPKIMETGKQISLLIGRDRSRDRVTFVPRPWLHLGKILGTYLTELFPQSRPQIGRQAPRGFPFPKLSDLVDPLREWYEDAAPVDDELWVIEHDGARYARPPALGWVPGFTMTTRYVAVASDPGRGTTDRTSMSSPLALPTLSVLAAGVQLKRVFDVSLPPPPFSNEIETFSLALADHLGGQMAEDIREVIRILRADDKTEVAITPVHDLTNQEFALLMQALQRPLQAALNLQCRLTLGARPDFRPSVSARMPSPQPPPDVRYQREASQRRALEAQLAEDERLGAKKD